MRRYESVWVVNGDLPDEEVQAAIDKFSRIISTQGGVLVGLEDWGRRKLSYRIKGITRGYYVVADYAGLPDTVKELERNYRIDDRMVRYHTTKKADRVNPEAIQAEIAAKAQAATPPAPVAAAPMETLPAASMETAAPEPPETAPAESAPQAKED